MTAFVMTVLLLWISGPRAGGRLTENLACDQDGVLKRPTSSTVSVCLLVLAFMSAGWLTGELAVAGFDVAARSVISSCPASAEVTVVVDCWKHDCRQASFRRKRPHEWGRQARAYYDSRLIEQDGFVLWARGRIIYRQQY